MAYFRQFGIGTPIIGTPMANTLDTLTELQTGKPAVGPTGRTPVHIGYDPLASTWDALTQAPVTSDIVFATDAVITGVVDVGKEVADVVVPALEDILSFLAEAAKALKGLIGDLGGFTLWMLQHPGVLIGSVVAIGGLVVYVALK